MRRIRRAAELVDRLGEPAGGRMELRERVLYHQIHPLKLATDWATAIVAAVLLWRHRLVPALAVGFLPSVLVSVLLIRGADLRAQRDSAPGRYVAGWMTRGVEAARFGGLAIGWAGAWAHRAALVALGVVAIVGCWLGGLLRRTTSTQAGR
jgi:hypothetical protein